MRPFLRLLGFPLALAAAWATLRAPDVLLLAGGDGLGAHERLSPDGLVRIGYMLGLSTLAGLANMLNEADRDDLQGAPAWAGAAQHAAWLIAGLLGVIYAVGAVASWATGANPWVLTPALAPAFAFLPGLLGRRVRG